MPKEEETVQVIVSPVADLDEPAEPSTQVPCDRCGVMCWLGESTALAIAHFDEREFACMRCMAQEFIANGPPDKMRSPWGNVPEPFAGELVRWTIEKYGL